MGHGRRIARDYRRVVLVLRHTSHTLDAAAGGTKMTTAEYFKILKKLGLSPHSLATAKALGVSPRMARYYAAGRPLPRLAIVRLLRLARRASEPELLS